MIKVPFNVVILLLLVQACSQSTEPEEAITNSAAETTITEALQGKWVKRDDPSVEFYVHKHMWVERTADAAADSFYLRIKEERIHPVCKSSMEPVRYFVLSSKDKHKQYEFLEISGNTLTLNIRNQPVWFTKAGEELEGNYGH